jgi:hypothetical protein
MIGAKESNGNYDYEAGALVFGVPKKGAINTKPIPKEWRGMMTDVTTHNPGHKRNENSEPGLDPARSRTTDKHDYIAPGMSIGQIDSYGAGTLGMIVWDAQTGDPRILTNDHVIPGHPGIEITQPSIGESHSVNVIGAKIRGTQSVFDYSISELYPGFQYSNVPLGHLKPIAGLVEAEVGQVIHKMGRTTAKTTGRIVAIGVVKMEKRDRVDYVWSAKIKPLDEQNADDYEVSEAGDSGSVWFDDEMRAVALHFAGETVEGGQYEFGEACPMVDLLRHAKCSIDDPRQAEGMNRKAVIYKLDQVIGAAQVVETEAVRIQREAEEIKLEVNA